jgi:hypothetical protein
LPFTGDKWDHLNAIPDEDHLRWPGNRAAYQSTDAQFDQAKRLPYRGIVANPFLGLTNDPPVLRLHDVNLPSYIEDRGDSSIPDGKRSFHCRLSSFSSARNMAICVPGSMGDPDNP